MVIMKASLSLGVLVTLVLAAQAMSAAKTPQATVDAVVKEEVQNAIKRSPAVGAALVRLVFHDCWVRGCDASVLLDKTPTGGSVEKKAANNIGLAGFDVIDSIKARLRDVSCADIIVFAGRESARILSKGGIDYALAPGRLDGVVSSAAEADATLPEPTFSFQQLKDNFNRTAGFDVEDLVILSGAHSIGVAHRTSFQDRLDEATQTPVNPDYQKALKVRVKIDAILTPNPTEKNNIRDMGPLFRAFSGYNSSGVNVSHPEAGALDNSYYTANLQNMVLFRSDWELTQDPTNFAGEKLVEYRDNATDWNLDFSDAMGRLSSLTSSGPKFEIRANCRRTNGGISSDDE